MRKTYRVLAFLLIFISAMGVNAQLKGIVPEGLKIALKQGNAKDAAKYFNASIELEVLGGENICSKTQAEQIIKQFFEQHAVSKFDVIFEGGKDLSQYAIGKLTTSKGIFRVNLLIKNQLVTQLRIEEDNGN